MYWSPNFLVVVFKKQDVSQHVVTRMQDLASEFSKNLRGDTPGPSQREGATPSAPNTQSGLWPGAWRKRPGVGTRTLAPQLFTALHGMQTRSSDENSVYPSVCLSVWLNDLSYDIKIWTDLSFILSQIIRLTDRRTDRILIARPSLHSMQRGKNHNGQCIGQQHRYRNVWTERTF